MKTLTSLFAAAVCVFFSSYGRGAVIADWTFDTGGAQNGTRLGTGANSALNYAANTRATADLTAATISAVHLGTSTASQGRAAGYTPSATTAMQFVAQTGTANSVNGSFFTLSLTTGPTIELTSVSLTYDVMATRAATGAANAWTLAGASTGNGTVTSTLTYPAKSWEAVTVTFSGVTVGPGTTITLTDALSGFANSTAGTASDVRFDNLQFGATAITGVPEPVNCALVLFGLAAVGGGAGRCYLGRKRQGA